MNRGMSKPEWRKWGLSIDESVYFGPDDRFERAKEAHNLVASYLERHPEEHYELFNQKGEVKYFDVLARAEREKP